MDRLQQTLLRAATDLRVLKARWALVGGLAVAIRAEPRQTKDVDLVLVVADDREAETLVKRFLGRGYTFHAHLEARGGGRLQGMRLLAPEERPGGVVVDLLFQICGIEREVVETAEELEVLEQFSIPVATTGHLLALKVLACQERSRDRLDVDLLLRAASAADVRQAEDALRLIMRRGLYQGEANLVVALRQAMRELEGHRGFER